MCVDRMALTLTSPDDQTLLDSTFGERPRAFGNGNGVTIRAFSAAKGNRGSNPRLLGLTVSSPARPEFASVVQKPVCGPCCGAGRGRSEPSGLHMGTFAAAF